MNSVTEEKTSVNPVDWRAEFDERDQKEIAYCLEYQAHYGHGTLGHNIRMIVAKMATILDHRDEQVYNYATQMGKWWHEKHEKG